jgi:hypothetical protein
LQWSTFVPADGRVIEAGALTVNLDATGPFHTSLEPGRYTAPRPTCPTIELAGHRSARRIERSKT